MIALILLIFASCKERSDHAAQQPLDKSASPRELAVLEKDINDEGLKRLREIDLAMSGWFLCQSNAIDLLDSFSGSDIKQVDPSRDEIEILDDQLVTIERIREEFESPKSKESSDEWLRLQLDALNYLINVSQEIEAFNKSKADYKIIIESQKSHLLKIIDELKILREKHPY